MSIELPHLNDHIPGELQKELMWKLYAWREMHVAKTDLTEIVEKYNAAADRCKCGAFKETESVNDQS